MSLVHFQNTAAIGHAWILSSPVQDEALQRAAEIASAAVCLAGQDVPCGKCRGCRKAAAGVHPDIIRIQRETDRSGKQRREITVNQIRELAADAAVLPNESERKVYIIEEADTMNLNAQNAALKLLEEPPQTVIFLLCTVNPDLLLETVRSRCLSVSVGSGAAEGPEEGEKRAAGFLKAMRSGDAEAVWRWIAKNETGKLDETAAFAEAEADAPLSPARAVHGISQSQCQREACLQPAGRLYGSGRPRTSGNRRNNMTEVVSIKFKNRGKPYFFDPAGLELEVGEHVLVDTAGGMEMGVVSRENHAVEDTAVVQPLRRVLRKATQMDLRTEDLIRQREESAMKICREKIAEHKLDMKLVDVECNFEGSKTTFFFTSDGRVDFRRQRCWAASGSAAGPTAAVSSWMISVRSRRRWPRCSRFP